MHFAFGGLSWQGKDIPKTSTWLPYGNGPCSTGQCEPMWDSACFQVSFNGTFQLWEDKHRVCGHTQTNVTCHLIMVGPPGLVDQGRCGPLGLTNHSEPVNITTPTPLVFPFSRQSPQQMAAGTIEVPRGNACLWRHSRPFHQNLTRPPVRTPGL